MEYDHPTAADYAVAAADRAQRQGGFNAEKLKTLEDRVEAMEKVLREHKLLPELELDPLPWVRTGHRYPTDGGLGVGVGFWDPRPQYEQSKSKYEIDSRTEA